MSAALVEHVVGNATVRAEAAASIETNGRHDGGIPYEDAFAGYGISLAAPASSTVYMVNNRYNLGYHDSDDDTRLTMAPSTLVLHLSGSKSAELLRLAHRWASAHHCEPDALELKCIASGQLCGGGRYRACKATDRPVDVYAKSGCSTRAVEVGALNGSVRDERDGDT
eukprot:7297678-Prymnesium_polylepis.1